jgi:DNA-binding transcriptional LysR family regulator
VPLLDYSAASGLGRIFRAVQADAAKGARLEPAFTSHLAVVLKSMALDGRGIAWLPESLVAEEREAGRLVDAGGEAARIKVAIKLFRQAGPESAAAEAFWRVAAR